jgi:hypothetical protein
VIASVAFALMSLLSAEQASAEPWELDFGGGIGGQLSSGRMARLAGNGAGFELHATMLPPKSPLGVRAEGAIAAMAEKQSDTSGLFLWWPVSMTLGTSHSIAWAAAGPEWRAPLGKGRALLYALAGYASVAPSTTGGSVNLPVEDFASTGTTVLVVGAVGRTPGLAVPRISRNTSIEFGIEYLGGGECTFYGDPPVVPDGAGGYVLRTERARLSMLGVRVGLVRAFGAP